MSQLTGERKSDDTFVDREGYVWTRLARSWKPGPLPKSMVEQAKRKYLVHMAATNISVKAAHFAGISVTTIRAWMRRGLISEEELENARRMYQEHLNASKGTST